MAVIPGLPTMWTCRDGQVRDLTQVPPGPNGPDDPVRPEKVAEWGRWASEVNRYRMIRALECRDDPEQQKIEDAKCAKYGPKYFITVHGWIHEPRPRRFNQVWALVSPDGVPPRNAGWLPAIPFAYQIDLIEWVMDLLDPSTPRRRGAISKPRDMGASWWVCLVVLWFFLFTDSFSAKFISRREDEVYRPRKLNCLMNRVACHLLAGFWPAATLPRFMLPQGWVDKDNLQELLMTHPENENIVTGEATTGRKRIQETSLC